MHLEQQAGGLACLVRPGSGRHATCIPHSWPQCCVNGSHDLSQGLSLHNPTAGLGWAEFGTTAPIPAGKEARAKATSRVSSCVGPKLSRQAAMLNLARECFVATPEVLMSCGSAGAGPCHFPDQTRTVPVVC